MSSENPTNPIYRLFPCQVFADLAPAARAIGLSEQTARDKLWQGKFPVQTVKIGRKRLVVVDDLAKYYSELVGLDVENKAPAAAAETTDKAPKRPRGRPRKYPAPAAVQEGGAQ